jgi:hypothetical protein
MTYSLPHPPPDVRAITQERTGPTSTPPERRRGDLVERSLTLHRRPDVER